MIATGPPGGHIADAKASLLPDGSFDLAVGTAEFGNGTTTVHRRIAAGELATTVDRITVRSPTRMSYAMTPAPSPPPAPWSPARPPSAPPAPSPTCCSTSPPPSCASRAPTAGSSRRPCCTPAARAVGVECAADGHFGGTPCSVAFNAQWFRVAVDPDTGEIRILRSVHAADAGKVMNPRQCRGQVEGGIAQALGATLFENVRLDARGAVETAAFRRYRLPQYTDVPRAEVHFRSTRSPRRRPTRCGTRPACGSRSCH